MITKEECLIRILDGFPKFQETVWKSHLESWGGEKPSFGNNIFAFSWYAIDLIKQDDPEVQLTLKFAEEMIEKGDEEVQTAFCTSFLENILNVTPTDISPERFVPYLGPKSRDYCKGWDEFTGVKTEGLWD